MIDEILSHDDHDTIIKLARMITGTRVNRDSHGIIIQNVNARILQLGLKDLRSYLEYLDRHDKEIPHLLTAVTIHTTSWFREFGALESFEKALHKGQFSKGSSNTYLRVLSVGCSTGQEVYSIGSILNAYRKSNAGFDFIIEGWDIDPVSIHTARKAIYPRASIIGIPATYQPYLQQCMHNVSGNNVTVNSELKNRCSFRAVNILSSLHFASTYDVIFCRNMLIYFDKDDVQKVINFFSKNLADGGGLCLGVSETGAVDSVHFKSLGKGFFIKEKLSGDTQKSFSTTKSIPSEKKPKELFGSIILFSNDDKVKQSVTAGCSENGLSLKIIENHMLLANFDKIDNFKAILVDKSTFEEQKLSDLAILIRKKGFTGKLLLVRSEFKISSDIGFSANKFDATITHNALNKRFSHTMKRFLKSNRINNEGKLDLILLGASTGGTEVLAKFVSKLPNDCPPVIVVQHISEGFAKDFGERLARVSGLTLGNIEENELIKNGHIYISLGDYHIGVREDNSGMRLTLNQKPPITGHRPSIDFLFQSCAKVSGKIFAALFTGMGKDGAQGLLELRQRGAHTYAQDEQSSTVFGMPKEAIKIGAAQHVGNPVEIREHLDGFLHNDLVEISSTKVI